jgi:uncharacterized protein YkwD
MPSRKQEPDRKLEKGTPHMHSTFAVRRLTTAAIAALGLVGASAATTVTTAQAATSCSSLERSYADRNIAKVTLAHRERTAWCVINDARRANGAPALKDISTLRTSALRHATRATKLRWWSLTDGLSSHVDPSQQGMTPSAAIAQRIANAGYCATGTPNTNENTFSAWGNGQFPATIRGAVNWWLQDPPHRATLLSTAYRSVGVGIRPASAFPADTPGAQAITVVADFGACAA